MEKQQLKGRELKVYKFLKDAKKQYETSGKVSHGVYKKHNVGKSPINILFSVIQKNGDITRKDAAVYIKRTYQYRLKQREQNEDRLKKHNILSFVKGIFQSIGDKISSTKENKETRLRIDSKEKEQKTRRGYQTAQKREEKESGYPFNIPNEVLSEIKSLIRLKYATNTIYSKLSKKGYRINGHNINRKQIDDIRDVLEPEIHREVEEQQNSVHGFFKKADRLKTKFDLGDDVFFVDSPKIEKHRITSIQIIDAMNYKRPYIAYGIDNNYKQWYKEECFCDNKKDIKPQYELSI